MPKPQPRTDKTTLNALLVSGKLTGSEQTCFQQMYDDIMSGKIINLSQKQRLWADAIYMKHKLGEVRHATQKQARVRVKQETNFLDSMPLPKFPPGRTK